MADFKLNPKKRQELVTKFETLLKSSIDEQVEFFLKSFIFVQILMRCLSPGVSSSCPVGVLGTWQRVEENL